MATPKKLICLITGANQGIGFETAKALATRSRGPNGEVYHVLVGSRDLAKGEKAVADIIGSSSPPIPGSLSAIQLDVTSPESVAAAAARVEREYGRLDSLVNNAGILSQDPDVTVALRRDLEVNVLGAAIVTEAFLPLLLGEAGSRGGRGGGSGGGGGGDDDYDNNNNNNNNNNDHDHDHDHDPRLVFVSSSMGSLTGASDAGCRYYRSGLGTSPLEYRVSKTALNMIMLEYWKRYGAEVRVPLGDRGVGAKVRVWSADPGPNATKFLGEGLEEVARKMGVQGPEEGAKVLVGCVTGERDGEEGKVVGAYGIGLW